ncbi:MAG: GspE/PulE family protein, partial [Thermodesulfobacteriota bacterium]|nr:GspE/PulE family protein [Thermodesulfobacteriota bacterium]
IEFEEEEETEEEAPEDLGETSSQVVRTVDQILISAYRKNASDIHVEPSSLTKKLNIRFRIDGVCQNVLQMPIINAKGIISRIKIMSNLDIAEKRLPQDGKIKFARKGIKPFELRVATLPTAGGYEDAVLRILAESGAMKLDDMGLNKRNIETIKDIISQPYGLFLVVGPTGSGKTTTLHSALAYINKPEVKIWTAEDPVEITQHGLRQVECKSKIGLDFARVMRAFLRADPDIIMIGEMRDNETASTGIEASLTGHLVFSTLHTNSAPETVTRLLDMGLNPLNFSDAFLGVLAQRLVRRLCKKCRKEYHPSEEEFEDIIMLYGKEYFESSGIEYSPELTMYRADGCDLCNGTGYKGRLGIHELMKGTKEIKRMIKKEAPTEELSVQAAKDGMTTLIQDGIKKAFDGLTDLNEIKRVCVTS